MAKPSTQVNTWEAKLLKSATIAARVEAKVSEQKPNISVTGGQISVAGQNLGSEIVIAALDQAFVNVYYQGAYDPNNIVNPDCFAIATVNEDGELVVQDAWDGTEGSELKPHKNSANRQFDTCAKCPMNQFGSAAQGAGKACQNTRRIAAIRIGETVNNKVSLYDADKIAAQEIGFLKIPATGIKSWSAFVSKLSNVLGKPTWAMATRLASQIVPGKTYFLPTFAADAAIPDKLMPAVYKQVEQAQQEIAWAFAPKVEDDSSKGPKKTPRRKYT